MPLVSLSPIRQVRSTSATYGGSFLVTCGSSGNLCFTLAPGGLSDVPQSNCPESVQTF